MGSKTKEWGSKTKEWGSKTKGWGSKTKGWGSAMVSPYSETLLMVIVKLLSTIKKLTQVNILA